MKFKIVCIVIFLMGLHQLVSQAITMQNHKGESVQLYKESYALIIGVSNYNNGWPTLSGVMKDIAEIKDILELQGFHVTTVIDPSLQELREAYRLFINKHGLDPENRLLMYFAGHGHTISTSYGEEMGYIVPVDAPNPNIDKNGFLSNAMAMQQIEVFAKQIQSKHALFLFDACFSGSIFAISRAIPENISYKTAKPVRQFITSGSADETVPDESVFRSQFVSALEGEADVNIDGFVTGTELGEFLQEKVVNYSNGSQHPQYGKIRNPHLDKGDFVFLTIPNEENGLSAAGSNNAETAPIRSGEVSKDNNVTSIYSTYTVLENQSLEERIVDIPEIFAKIALMTAENKFVCAESGGGNEVNASRDGAAVWETFRLIPLNNNKYAFLTYSGNYLNISADGRFIEASAKGINEKTNFELIELENNKYAIRASNDMYVCALDGGDGALVPTSHMVQAHEVFTIVFMNTFGIISNNGLYATNNSDKIEFTSKQPKENEVFTFIKLDRGKIAIKASNGNFLSITDKDCQAIKTSLDNTSVFDIQIISDNSILLKTIEGKYLTAIGGGGFSLRARKIEAGDWERFKLYPIHFSEEK